MQLLRKPGQMNIETLPDYGRSDVAHHKKRELCGSPQFISFGNPA
jgi:hypothetical protein